METTPLPPGKRGAMENCRDAEATEEAVAALAAYLLTIEQELSEILRNCPSYWRVNDRD